MDKSTAYYAALRSVWTRLSQIAHVWKRPHQYLFNSWQKVPTFPRVYVHDQKLSMVLADQFNIVYQNNTLSAPAKVTFAQFDQCFQLAVPLSLFIVGSICYWRTAHRGTNNWFPS